MTVARRIIEAAATASCHPWPRRILPTAEWAAMAAALPSDSLILLALWADTLQVHALLLDQTTLTAVPVSTSVEAGVYPALSPHLPHAAWFERMIHDLWGRAAQGGRDQRAWLDHGTWPLASPLAVRPDPPRPPYDPPDPPTAPSDPMMQLPLGPIWGRIEEAAQLRLTLDGAAVVAAEARLGFSHKGTLSLLRGKPPRTAARYAARLSGDCTVAHATAFAAAAEAALQVEPPPRAAALRIVMLEIERIAGHFDNLTEVARLADCQPVRTQCGYLRERLLRTAESAFGHRLMMDCVVPGGLALDMAEGGRQVILRALGDISSQLPAIRRLHHDTALAARLSGVGRVDLRQATALGVGGIVGRAAGRRFDARALPRTTLAAPASIPTGIANGAPTDAAAGGMTRVTTGGAAKPTPRSGLQQEGDAIARQNQRISEIDESLGLISAALDHLPPGPLTAVLPQASGEGIGCAESIRGDIWHWLRLDHGQIAGCFPRDPGWALWPLAEQVLRSSATTDVDLIRASLALPASGMDL